MATPRPTFFPEIEALLRDRSVAFREISAPMLQQLPNSRIEHSAFLFPGSKFKLSHVILISRAKPGQLLITAYSKTLKFDLAEQDYLVDKAMSLNAEENLVFWKVERRGDVIIPVLEMLVGGVKFDADSMWRCFGALDSRFKMTAEELLVQSAPQQEDITQRVKKFLSQMGFTRIKEGQIEGGQSLLIVLSDDDQPETSDLKRFPMKIEIAKMIVFKVYFSMKDAAVVAKDNFEIASKRFIAEVNWRIPIGAFSFSSLSKQIQYTIKLNYSLLNNQDFQVSLKSYYEHIITWYKYVNQGLAKLYQESIGCPEIISDMSPYLSACSDELQGEEIWLSLDYANNPEEYERDAQKFEVLKTCKELKPYLLEVSFFRLNPEAKKVAIKKKRSLLSFSEFTQKYPNSKHKVFSNAMDLYEVLSGVHLYPTVEMLHFNDDNPAIVFIPGKGMHSSKKDFLEAILANCLAKLDLSTMNLEEMIQLDYLFQPIDGFEAIGRTVFDDLIQGKSSLAGDEYLFYEVTSPGKSLKYSLLLDHYRSRLSKEFMDYPNPLTGWTTGVENYLSYEDTESHSTQITRLYICEKQGYKLWHGNQHLNALLKVAQWLKSLHQRGFCHWFINPLTIRQQEREGKMYLVLPAMDPFFGELVASIIPEEYRSKFLAPEVEKFLSSRKVPVNIFAADVYSLCGVIESSVNILLNGNGAMINFASEVRRGLSEMWDARPSLDEIITQLQQAIEAYKKPG